MNRIVEMDREWGPDHELTLEIKELRKVGKDRKQPIFDKDGIFHEPFQVFRKFNRLEIQFDQYEAELINALTNGLADANREFALAFDGEKPLLDVDLKHMDATAIRRELTMELEAFYPNPTTPEEGES